MCGYGITSDRRISSRTGPYHGRSQNLPLARFLHKDNQAHVARLQSRWNLCIEVIVEIVLPFKFANLPQFLDDSCVLQAPSSVLTMKNLRLRMIPGTCGVDVCIVRHGLAINLDMY